MQSTNSSLQFAYYAYHASQHLVRNYVPYLLSSDLASYKTILLGAALTGACIWAAKNFLFKNETSEPGRSATPSKHTVTPKSAQDIAPTQHDHTPVQSELVKSATHTTESKASLSLAGIAGEEISKSLSSTNRASQRDDDLQSIASSIQSNAEVQFTND